MRGRYKRGGWGWTNPVLADGSARVDCMFTSPPYAVGVDYGEYQDTIETRWAPALSVKSKTTTALTGARDSRSTFGTPGSKPETGPTACCSSSSTMGCFSPRVSKPQASRLACTIPSI
jgi:hypothetical protein